MGPCPTCGTVNKVSARFCTKCGTPLAGPTARIEASDQDPAAPPAANPPGAQPAQSSAAPVSPNQPVASGPTAQVPSPGAVPPTATVPPPVGVQSASAPSIACPHCGTPNRMGARICKKCGKSLSAAPVGASGSFPPTPIPVAPPVPPVPPAPPAPVPQMAVPSLGAAKRPPRPPFVAIGVLVLLVLGLCSGLGAVFYLEGTSPTATVAAVVPPTPTPTLTPTIPPRPTAIVAPTQTPTATPNPPFPVVMLLSTADGRFGFATKQGDPANANDDNKPLTYRKEKSTEPADGSTSNTRISIDGQTPLYGGKEGRFISPPSRSSDDSQLTAAWQYGSIVVTETVKVVLSSSTHRLDTFEIRYDAENRDTQLHNVGVRLMLDTLIGDNDGVPFNVPGIGLVQTPLQLSGDKIPNFVQVYENADVANPGVTLQMTLTGGEATAPDRFVIAPWCNKDESWDFWAESGAGKNSLNQCGNMTKKGDSSVGIYFDPKPLAAGETRHWTTFYGLGEIKPVVVPGAKLGVPNPPAEVKVGEEFWVTALVQNPKPGQTVKLIFPAEFQLTDGTAEQTVDAKGATQVQLGWRLRAVKPGGNLALHVVLNPDNAAWDGKVSVIQLPTPTPLPPTLTPTKCATTVTHPICP